MAWLQPACGWLPAPLIGRARAEDLDTFFDEFTAEWMRNDPDLAASARYFTGAEQNALEQRLTPRTREHERDVIARARRGLEKLAAFDASDLQAGQRLARDVMRWQLEVRVESEPFLSFDFPLQQHSGANVRLPDTLIVRHPMKTAQDVENYVLRLSQVDDRMREATHEAAESARRGILPPRFILTSTIAQMRRFISPLAADNPLVATLRDKSASIADLDAARREALIAQATSLVESAIYPAWRAAIAELESQVPGSSDDAGLWRFENGAEIYAHALERFTTTDLSADEIHDIGLAEVARIESEMDGLLTRVGLPEGSVAERCRELRKRLAYPATDAGRQQIMADLDAYLADALRRSEGLFPTRPKAPVIVQPYPRFRWENAAASYTPPPLDGSRPGIFQMPLREERLNRFGLRTLVYHETVPGHHFQVALATENRALPRFVQVRAFGGISSFTEGWALYAERLAAESGWYDGDVEGHIGQLDAALFRARRLVVDTGLHAKRWTRQQAIDYGIPAAEVERYVVRPGQACSYMIGLLKIVELRDRARAKLGEKFSLEEFHDLVLGLGFVPLPLLEREVERFVEAR